MATKQAEKMYGNSPKSERDPEDGKVKVKKAEKPAEETEEAVTEGGAESEGMPVAARHMMERSDMHHTMEKEHHMHDVGKGEDKKEMHSRHAKMMSELHKKHEKEMNGKEKE